MRVIVGKIYSRVKDSFHIITPNTNRVVSVLDYMSEIENAPIIRYPGIRAGKVQSVWVAENGDLWMKAYIDSHLQSIETHCWLTFVTRVSPTFDLLNFNVRLGSFDGNDKLLDITDQIKRQLYG